MAPGYAEMRTDPHPFPEIPLPSPPTSLVFVLIAAPGGRQLGEMALHV